MKSMTGYGTSTQTSENLTVTIELKSVNHRYLDLQFHLPRDYRFLEPIFRDFLKKHLFRGRVEVFLTVEQMETEKQKLLVNWDLLDQLTEQLRKAKEDRYGDLGLDLEQLFSGVASQKEFFSITETEQIEKIPNEVFLATLSDAWQGLEKSRQTEGDGLAKVMFENLSLLKESVLFLQNRQAVSQEDYVTRLTSKLDELIGAQIEESRLLTEVALLVERGDIQEELDRLIIHSETMEQLFQKEGPVGRELDFLIQEMNREVNTIGSKSVAITIKNTVVQLKTLLEKIREQVQNVE